VKNQEKVYESEEVYPEAIHLGEIDTGEKSWENWEVDIQKGRKLVQFKKKALENICERKKRNEKLYANSPPGIGNVLYFK